MEENLFKNLLLQPEYNSLEEDVIREFFVPVLGCAIRYDRAAGFFSSSGLAKQTVGLCQFIKNNGKMRLIASPKLSPEDLKAIAEGYKLRDEILRETLLRELRNPSDDYEAERLNLLSNLIAADVLDIKIAVLRNESGIFHDKFGILYDSAEDVVAFRGSMNESENAYYHNFESIDVYKSWDDEYRVSLKQSTFDELWNEENSEVETIAFPDVNEELVRKYKTSDSIDEELDIKQFGTIKRPKGFDKWLINIPANVEIRPYQSEAIDKWEDNDFQGLFDMATGTGKTYTALAGLERFEKRKGNIFAIVVCPYIHLVDQWADDAQDWGMTPVICHSQAKQGDWRKNLVREYKRYRSTNRSGICIVTNDTFADSTFQEVIQNISLDMNAVLVVDEVHNFGSKNLAKIMPKNIRYRLGLSATIERFEDSFGTKAIFDYFGDKCIEYPLQQAIQDGALVQYEYYPVLCSLTGDERAEYNRLTSLIAKQIKKEQGKSKLTKTGELLVFKRSRVITGAAEKVPKLKELLSDKTDDRHILVYCGATKGLDKDGEDEERQIDAVEKMIGNELKMSTHRFTAEEDGRTRRLIKEGFADGEYQVVTAIKCLDEGVNIPNIHTAYILASSRNPKEFIQRRGRVLRKAEGKNRAIIYDFVTLPRDLSLVHFGDIDSDRSIVYGELARAYEFGRYSINSRVADSFIEEVKGAYGIEVSNDEFELKEEDMDETED